MTGLDDRRGQGLTGARVLVTDGENRSTVAVVRGLAEAGMVVTAAAAGRGRVAAAHLSRAVTRRMVVPDPLVDENGFLNALERAVTDDAFQVLIPGSDASLLSVSAARERFEFRVRIGLPAHAVVRRSLDKAALGAQAARHGLDPPETVLCRDLPTALSVADYLRFPVVIKPRSSIIEGPNSNRRLGSLLAYDPAAVEQALAAFGGTALVQRRVHGNLVSFAGVIIGGRLLGEAFSRYRRIWPPEAGNACFSETADAPPELRRRVVSLLEELGWEGIFELELLERNESCWHVIDLNPRPYGSLALALAAGVNLPSIWCRHLLGLAPASRPAKASPGMAYRWTDADVRHALWQLRSGNPDAAIATLRPRRRVVHPYFQRADAGPLIARMLELGVNAVPRGRSRHRPKPGRSPTVVLGAGPNGLAATAYLRASGIEAVCLGETLESWSRHMPAGMLLTSHRRSSHIPDPHQALTIDAFELAEHRRVHETNLTLAEFVDYGRWFQRQAVPDVDPRRAHEVARDGRGFRVQLDDGDELIAPRVVVAAGLGSFPYVPEPFAALDSGLCTHTYEHAGFEGFRGRRVVVVGSGLSALESAALLHEAGAEVEVLARAPRSFGTGINENGTRPWSLGTPISVSSGIGAHISRWIAATPDLYRRLPDSLQPAVSSRGIREAGAEWLRTRLAAVPITLGTTVAATRAGAAARLELSDGSTRTVDHVLLGTGYRIDVRRYPFLSPSLTAQLRVANGYPVLGRGLESSVPGLHFMGATAAHSFGPIMRFIVGTGYAAPAVARRAAERRQPLLRVALPSPSV